jgi:hypothetical protein
VDEIRDGFVFFEPALPSGFDDRPEQFHAGVIPGIRGWSRFDVIAEGAVVLPLQSGVCTLERGERDCETADLSLKIRNYLLRFLIFPTDLDDLLGKNDKNLFFIH